MRSELVDTALLRMEDVVRVNTPLPALPPHAALRRPLAGPKPPQVGTRKFEGDASSPSTCPSCAWPTTP